jgi:predicted DNA-binding transcriptional regulator AlpA
MPSLKSHKRYQVESTPRAGDAAIELIYKPELLALVGHSYGSIFVWMRKGEFPLARQIGPDGHNSKIAWFRHEVDKWLRSRPTARLPRRESFGPKRKRARDGGKAA